MKLAGARMRTQPLQFHQASLWIAKIPVFRPGGQSGDIGSPHPPLR